MFDSASGKDIDLGGPEALNSWIQAIARVSGADCVVSNRFTGSVRGLRSPPPPRSELHSTSCRATRSLASPGEVLEGELGAPEAELGYSEFSA